MNQITNFFPTPFGGGTKVANNLITTEEGFCLDARQGKILNDYIAQVNDDLLKMVQASGVITGDDDWNKYINAGVYKVQDANMTAENHAPVGMRGDIRRSCFRNRRRVAKSTHIFSERRY